MNKFKLDTSENPSIANLIERIENLDIFSQKTEQKIGLLCAQILCVSKEEDFVQVDQQITSFVQLMKALQIFNPDFIKTVEVDLRAGLETRQLKFQEKPTQRIISERDK